MNSFDAQGFIKNQEKSWNAAASGWEKWDVWLNENMSYCSMLLIERADIRLGYNVLDLGSGTGHPAIITAGVVGKEGRVVGLDLSEEMLVVARRKSNGMENVTFQVCDVTTIPFNNNTFQAVTSRFCLMFLPYVDKALAEIYRVLRKNCFFSASVWALKEKNPSLSISFDIISEYITTIDTQTPAGIIQPQSVTTVNMQTSAGIISPQSIKMPAPPPDQPGLFKLGESGLLKRMMEQAGFVEVIEEELRVDWVYASKDEFIRGMHELAAPIKAMLNQLSQGQVDEIEDRIKQKIEQYSVNGKIKIPGVAIIVSGRK